MYRTPGHLAVLLPHFHVEGNVFDLYSKRFLSKWKHCRFE